MDGLPPMTFISPLYAHELRMDKVGGGQGDGGIGRCHLHERMWGRRGANIYVSYHTVDRAVHSQR